MDNTKGGNGIKKKIIVIFVLMLLLATVCIQAEGFTNSIDTIQNFIESNLGEDFEVQGIHGTGKDVVIENLGKKKVDAKNNSDDPYKDDDNETSAFGYEFFGADWDANRSAWRYKFRFDWYQAYHDPGKYVCIEIDSRIKTKGIVKNSDNEFGQGGYNCSEGYTGDFTEIGSIVCDAVIAVLPWVNLFQSGFELAAALKDHSDQNPGNPSYRWMGLQTKEASGFYQYDVYIRPGSEYNLNFTLEFYTSRIKYPNGDIDIHLMWWNFSGKAPAHCTFTPLNYTFDLVKVGDCSENVRFDITNDGIEDCKITYHTNDNFKIIRGVYNLDAGDTNSIYLKFCPDRPKEYEFDFYAIVKNSDGPYDCLREHIDNNAYIHLSGVGKRLRNRVVDDAALFRLSQSRTNLLLMIKYLLKI